jgi:hypothetical protein
MSKPISKAHAAGSEPTQAAQFITRLREAVWNGLAQFTDGGQTFEMLTFEGKMLLVQIYPKGFGFEVWHPVTAAGSIDETFAAVQAYALERVGAGPSIQEKVPA